MKKVIITIVCLLLSGWWVQNVFAGGCYQERIDVNYGAKANQWVNVRTLPCMEKSSVITTISGGESVQVIQESDGWMKIRRVDGTEGWIWNSFLTKTSNTPVFTEIVNTSYQPTTADKNLVRSINIKIDKLLAAKGQSYAAPLSAKLRLLRAKYSSNKRIDYILGQVVERVEGIVATQRELEASAQRLENISDGVSVVKNVDMARVRETWLAWYNGHRRELGLHDYSYNSVLDKTAHEWSEISKARGYMDHRRTPGDAYYDYWKITDWFAKRGVVAKNINRVTHTENIGWWWYKCNDSDCTDELTSSIRSTFDFFYNERFKEYQAHYKSMINSYFNEIGLGIVIDESLNRYYLTVHFVTELE